MPTSVPHEHHHHHAPGQGHPPAAIAPSILRMGLAGRLGAAAVVIGVIWGVVLWAMS
jgi:hypothetical protein